MSVDHLLGRLADKTQLTEHGVGHMSANGQAPCLGFVGRRYLLTDFPSKANAGELYNAGPIGNHGAVALEWPINRPIPTSSSATLGNYVSSSTNTLRNHFVDDHLLEWTQAIPADGAQVVD